MEIKLLSTVFILVTIISVSKTQENTTPGPTQTTENPTHPEEEVIHLDEDLQERKLTIKANTFYKIIFKDVCVKHKLSVAVLEAKCNNTKEIRFNGKGWECQNMHKTTRVFDSANNSLAIDVPSNWENNKVVLLITAYFVNTAQNLQCPGVGAFPNHFTCVSCEVLDNNEDDSDDPYYDPSLRFIHNDLKCNGRNNCDKCNEDHNDEENEECPLENCSENYWTGFHDTQYMLTILLAGLFFIMSPIVLVMVLFYNRKMSPAARERARLRARENDPGRYSRTVQPPPTYEDVHDIKDPPPTFHEVVLDDSEEIVTNSSRTINNNHI